MSHIWMSHITYFNESCRTYECAMSHIWMSPITYHSCEWAASHVGPSHITYMNEPRHIHENFTSHIWLSHVTRMDSHVTHVNESCSTYECHMYEPCHVYARLIHVRDVWMNRLARVYTYEWVIYMIWIHMNESYIAHIYIWMSHIYIHMDESYSADKYIWMSHIPQIAHIYTHE